MKNYKENTKDNERLKSLFEKLTNPLGNIRPGGIFGYLIFLFAYYLYKNLEIGSI
ncbi:MAG: hypothetical protein QXW97_00185 [Candidatus Pacearchaeota archaeon]